MTKINFEEFMAACLIAVSLEVALFIFLPMLPDGRVFGYEHSVFIRWGEFITYLLMAGVGVVYLIRSYIRRA